MLKYVLLTFAILGIAGCMKPPTHTMQLPVTTTSHRINVKMVDTIEDGLAYGNRRGIYIITDTETGKEYIGISGVGISETGSHSSGKSTHSDER